MVFSSKAKEEFDVKNITLPELESFIKYCANVYEGKPEWIDEEDDIKTFGFAEFICSEVAKLSSLGMRVQIDDESDRGELLQEQVDSIRARLREWIEYACGYGTVILKPNGESIDLVLPDDFMVTNQANGKITGIVFFNKELENKKHYTRLEYHRFDGNTYVITNKCFTGEKEGSMDKPVPIEDTPWADLQEETFVTTANGEKIDGMLFGVLRTPKANTIDKKSPLGLPIFSTALEELLDVDVALSRNSLEIKDSKKLILLDSDRLLVAGKKYNQASLEQNRQDLRLPHYVRNVMGQNGGDFYQEINPTLNTQTRLIGIDSLLSQIGFKCGFSNGYFVYNQSTGFATATQVTSDQARTIQLVKDMRENVDECMLELIKALNIFEDLFGSTRHIDIVDTITTEETERTIHLHADPIYTNDEEDRMRGLQLTNSGYYPKWYYLHKYEGLEESEAKRLVEEAQPKGNELFYE